MKYSTLLLIIVLYSFNSCKKKESIAGKDIINDQEYLNSTTDTLDIITYTIAEDSTITDNPANAVLGSYVDPKFGKLEAYFYTQFRLATVNPDFGDITTIKVDSFVLALEYAGYYGDLSAQTFQVYEMDSSIYLDSTYYAFTEKNTKSTNLIPLGKETISPKPNDKTVVGSDTVDAQLRIPLDTNFAKSLIVEAESGNSSFTSNENFLSFFKGLKVKTNNINQNVGQGAILYFNLNDPASKATIYFTQGGVNKSYDLLINSSCADFNHVEVENGSYPIQAVLADSTKGMTEFYAQAFKHRAVVKIPSIQELPSNIIVHRANLTLPIQFQTGYRFKPGSFLSVSTKIKASDNNLTALPSLGEYLDSKKHFNVDLKDYVQAVHNGDIENTGVYLSPRFFINSAERVVFNGKNSTNKKKPQLVITYSTF